MAFLVSGMKSVVDWGCHVVHKPFSKESVIPLSVASVAGGVSAAAASFLMSECELVPNSSDEKCSSLSSRSVAKIAVPISALSLFLAQYAMVKYCNFRFGQALESRNFAQIASSSMDCPDLIDLNRDNIDVNVKDAYGKTLLHWAAEKGNVGFIRRLLKNPNIDLKAQDNNGRTALHWAAGFGHSDAVLILSENDDAGVQARDAQGLTPLHLAAGNGHVDVIRKLLENRGTEENAKSEDGLTPLHFASLNGHANAVRVLLESNNIEAGARTSNGRTALDFAAAGDHADVVRAFSESGKMEAKSNNEAGSLHFAVLQGNIDAVRELLKDPATDPTDLDYQSMVALHPQIKELLDPAIQERKAAVKPILEDTIIPDLAGIVIEYGFPKSDQIKRLNA